MNPRDYITETLATAKFPAVFTSFGKDSLLLMAYAPNATLYHFGPLSEFAQHYIMDNDLTVFSYAPADRYLVETENGKLAMIDEYAVNGLRIPTITDVVEGGNCRHGVPTNRTMSFRFPHDVALWGYKASDFIPAIVLQLEKETVLGDCRYIAPLYEMTDVDVYEALETLEIALPPIDDGVEFCSDCLDSLDRASCRHNLEYFRQRFTKEN